MKPWARYINIVLGVWLALSAFFWPHSSGQQINAFVVGVIIAGIAWAALRAGPLRFINTAIAVWLGASTWLIPDTTTATMWNAVLVAVPVFVFSLVPGSTGTGARRGTKREPAHAT